MNTRNLVSVVLGAYNGERYLKEQIDSILEQTYRDIELIITDDCSTDDTAGILKDYAGRYENVHVYFNEENLGLIRNYEKALKYPKGAYIAFADQDDIWLPHKIQSLLDNIGDSMLIYSDCAYIDADGRLMGKKLSDYRNLISGRNLYMLDSGSGIWIAAHAMMFRRELLDPALPFSPYFSHDTWLAYIAMLKGNVTFLPEVLVLYRQHGANTVGGLGCHKMMKNARPARAERYMMQQLEAGRIDALLSRAAEADAEFRDFLNRMKTCAAHPVFYNRVRRMLLRFKYVNRIYAPRKRNVVRRLFKAIKSF
ncbi:MAG: glycosyltransferase family 2 protein [Tannerellaceae bacterium]|jgi:glycosyltransferase involved in cell wall biosynthesis|nr:glycosyltransferase family 2 protein [Tannerellaceae bacterium]